MCLGIPFQITSVEAGFAQGQDNVGHTERLNTALIGDPQVGQWVLGFLGNALEILSPERADEMNEAHAALRKVYEGVSIAADDFSFNLPSQMASDQIKTLTGQG